MNITPKFNFVEGSFDTKEVKMLCIASDNSRRMTFEVLGIAIGKGNVEWGAPTDRQVFIIKLGSRISVQRP